MEPLKTVNTGGLSFREMRRRGKFYVDKSLLIADLLTADDSGVYLFTRPRRFGKTTNITMLDAYFNQEYADNDWFDGLEISEHHEFDAYKNAFPVIYIDLKDIAQTFGNTDFGYFISRMKDVVSQSFRPFRYLLDSDRLCEDDKTRFHSAISLTMEEPYLISSIRFLCEMLEAHHGKKVIVLMDEYDRAVTDSFGDEIQKRIVGFLGSFMSSTLKSNNSLQMAYVTGVMQVAKAGMFSGVNNLTVNNVFSLDSDERFGFTESEVMGILDYYGRSDKLDEVREWYDGYCFGNAEVYNPFSVMSYVSRNFVTDSYWANSGNDKPMRWMLDRTDAGSVEAFTKLISRKSVQSDIHLDMTYEDMRLSSMAELHSLMVMTGYLKAVPRTDAGYDVSIPNKEVMGLVEGIFRKRIKIDDTMFREFCLAVLDADSNRIESTLGYLFGGTNYYGIDGHMSYELALLLIMRGIIPHYDVRSERQEGNGRVDLILTPLEDGYRPIIIELKKADSVDDLDREAAGAIRQIHDRRYYNLMHGEVSLIGIAFHGIIPKAVAELHKIP